MKFNPLLNEIAKGVWAMSFDGLTAWAPIASKLMAGEKVVIESPKADPGMSLMNVIDNTGRRVMPDENGQFNAPKGSVAIINISDVLIKYGDWCIYGALEIVERLYAADRNPNIVGTVAYFDGPGGAVSA